MATKRPEFTWENGFCEVAPEGTSHIEQQDESLLPDDYVPPPWADLVTSSRHNSQGVNVIRDWPSIYNGSNSPHGIPSWWKPQEQVDVLIVGAGPSGLGIAASLARQGCSFRVIDKAETPLIAGRADGVQPRFLETIATWGLADEVAEEGPLIERTAMYRDGEKLTFGRSHQSDSRYRGLHIITQGQVERIYIRDLLRHKSIVERNSILSNYSVGTASADNPYPISATIQNIKTGAEQSLSAKFIVGTDGGASNIRKSLKIPFDGVSTDIYWGILDAVIETDYPHAWVFGMVISTEHGCCCIIPREDNYIRLYTKLDVSHTGPISASRQAKDPTFAESGGNVDAHSITPDEVLEQANRIFAPYKLKFGSKLSWFSIWKISERVARAFSSPDQRVHLAGDAAHIHSVMGAFGLNASILDAANIGWKLGFASRGIGIVDTLLPTYNAERRKHAARIIKVSGEYLRWICGSPLAVADLSDIEALEKADRGEAPQSHVVQQVFDGTPNESKDENQVVTNNTAPKDSREVRRAKDFDFIAKFFKENGKFLLGVDCPYDESVIAPPTADGERAVSVKHGVRAPNPRVCFTTTRTGYLYDKLGGPARLHLVVFGSSLSGSEVRRQLSKFTKALEDPSGFYQRFGGSKVFNVVLVAKLLPFEYEEVAAKEKDLLGPLERIGASVVFDDRAPDEDAHYTYGVNHKKGAVSVVRPDLWHGMACFPEETEKLDKYFSGFLQAA